MANYSYTALNISGQSITGETTASSRETALAALRQQGLRPTSIAEAKPKVEKRSFGSKKVKSKDLVIFTRELSTMVSAGVSLPRALNTLAGQAENPAFKKVITAVDKDVESGDSLADSMKKHPEVFSDVYVNMVMAGEAGGILDEILKRLATQVEKDAGIKKKIKSAMAYPVVIMFVTIAAFFGIMLFVLPKIGKILTDLGGPNVQLPFYTQILLGFSSFFVKPTIMASIPVINNLPLIGRLPNAVLLFVAMAIGIIYLKKFIKTPKGAYLYNKVLMKLPIVGPVVTKIAVARFARTFSSLMGAGVSVLDSLEVTGKAMGNKVFQKQLEEVAKAVKNGQPLGKQIAEAGVFPPIVGQMLTVGEETGKVDQILVKVADYYEEEVEAVIDGLASVIEPVMIVVLGGMVGVIALAVMGPIASLSQNLGTDS